MVFNMVAEMDGNIKIRIRERKLENDDFISLPRPRLCTIFDCLASLVLERQRRTTRLVISIFAAKAWIKCVFENGLIWLMYARLYKACIFHW